MQENKKNRDASIFMNREEKQKLKAEKKQQKAKEKQERKEVRSVYKETKGNKAREIKWGKLDNTAHLFPVIAGEGMTNVYRVAVILKEKFSRNCCSRHWTWCCRNFLYLTADCVRVCSGIILK